MNEKRFQPEAAAALRRRAEETARVGAAADEGELPPEAARKVLHELKVHQIELEMQNEELRRAQAELEDSRARYFDLYDLAPVGYLTVSEQGSILEANLTAAGMLGVIRSSLVAQPLSRFVFAEDQDIYYRHRKLLFETGDPESFEIRLVRAGTVPFWVRLNATTVLEEDDARVCRAAISDISDHKRAEEELERSRVLLVQSQKLEAVGRLAGGVAHDFNNILQAMLSLSTVLELRAGSPELTKVVAEIEGLIKRGAGLTQQLLLFSRHEVAKRELIDLGAVVGATSRMLRRLIPESIRFEVRAAPAQLWVEAESGQLQQALVNLALNARDAMPDGGELTVETSTSDAGIVLEVTDTGRGIDGDVRAHLFEPFFTTKEPGMGTGLGLAIVRGVVEQLGGSIEVESAPGKGSRFRITLPEAAAPAQADHGPRDEIEPPDATGLPRGHGEDVVVVEDEEAAREGLAEILRFLGYRVTALGSGEEADALPPAPAPDLLLTDIVLPGIDGSEVARRLSLRWPRLKVVMMSGYTEDEAVRRKVASGNAPFLQKPFDMATLARELRLAFKKS